MAAYVLCVCDVSCVEAWATAQLNEEINEEIPDDGLKGSKHVGLFIKSVLSDFSVT